MIIIISMMDEKYLRFLSSTSVRITSNNATHSLRNDKSVSEVGLHSWTSTNTPITFGRHLQMNGIEMSADELLAILSINFNAASRSYVKEKLLNIKV